MNKNWVTQQNYDHKVNKVKWSDIRKKPEDYGFTEEQVEKKTVPGQAISIKQLMERYEKGRPIPQE